MQFTKLHGAGNDYILVDGLSQEQNWPKISEAISDRHFGIGSDGLIVVAPSDQADVRMRMFNPDGSESEMCGNGIRCFTKFVLERNLISGHQDGIAIETGAGVLSVRPQWENGRVIRAKVEMGTPVLRAIDVPVDSSKTGPSNRSHLESELLENMGILPGDVLFDAPIAVDGTTFTITAVSMGNPHAVTFITQPVGDIDLGRLGPLMEQHVAFPRRVNFHVVNVQQRDRVTTRPWERGAGQTLACATGACAVVVAGRLHGQLDDVVTVEVPGGELIITWPGHGSVIMEGPVQEVFSGEWSE
jgi:diaminopimelate epimerase